MRASLGRRVLVCVGLFLVVFATLHGVIRHVDVAVYPHDTARWWPIGVFYPAEGWWWMRPWYVFALAGGSILALVAATPRLRQLRWGAVAAWAGLLMVGSNALHGVPDGLEKPLSDPRYGGIQYWHEALEVESAATFLAEFNARQPELMPHSKTHPPGAILMYYAARVATGGSALLSSLLLSGLAFALLLWSLMRWTAAAGLRGPPARYVALSILLMPALQIYGIHTLDFVFTALLLSGFAALLALPEAAGRRRRAALVAMAAGSFFAASMLSFAVLAMLPPLGLVMLLRRELRWPALASVAIAAGGLWIMAAAGFDWLRALGTASALENPHGFRLLVNPREYLLTRLECVAEVAFFLGPVGWALLSRQGSLRTALKDARENAARLVALALVLTFLGMLATGAFHTGETARAAMFATPALLLFLLRDGDDAAMRSFAVLLTLQCIGFQLLADYFW